MIVRLVRCAQASRCLHIYPEGNPESGTEVRWHKNGALKSHLNDLLIVPAAETTKGDQWYFTVKPKDGTTFRTQQTSPTVTIQNTPSSISGVKIAPDPANKHDTLTANSTNPNDDDGDTITYTYQGQI